ncbi:adenylate kinase [Mycobacterium phage Knocker]|nr:adenylate kinase [Mycobacterium phage Knocker]
MTHRLVYVVGPPGSGKSTLMARLTEEFQRVPAIVPDHGPVAHDEFLDADGNPIDAAELGVQRGLFSGTDALPSSVIDKAVPWLFEKPYRLILAEGARLANKRFLSAAVEAGYEVVLAVLAHDDAEAWRKRRAKAIGRDQNPSWVKGRVTATANLATWACDQPGIDVVTGHPDAVFESLASVVSAHGRG